jgi:hypothetical protein
MMKQVLILLVAVALLLDPSADLQLAMVECVEPDIFCKDHATSSFHARDDIHDDLMVACNYKVRRPWFSQFSINFVQYSLAVINRCHLGGSGGIPL